MDTVSDRLIGTKLGRYQIEALLGRGRGAMVYRAIDPVVNRRVAIKVLDPGTARDRGLVEAFLHDTRVLANLRHPHILPIYESAEQDGRAYFVRLLTDGGTLLSRLQGGKRLPLGEAAAILRPVATALDYAHRQGIIHRNLRPSNILLAADEHVYVTDFSLPGKDQQRSAATTIVNATVAPAYVSPEQARGAALDGRSDIYVLTVILYEALVGRPPFQAENASETSRTVIARHLQDEPPAPSGLNPAIGQNVEAVLLRGLEKAPEKRFPTAAALFYALSEAEELDRSVRRQANATRPIPLAPAPPAAIDADLNDLLATLTLFDTPAADADPSTTPVAASPTSLSPTDLLFADEPEPTEVITPTPVAEGAPRPTTPPPIAPVAKVTIDTPAERAKPATQQSAPPPATATQAVAVPPPAPQAPPATAAAPQRSSRPFIIGGVAVVALLIAVALFALTRGGQATPEPTTGPEPAPTIVAQGAAPTIAVPPVALPSAANVPSLALAASAAPSVAATVAPATASAAPAGPVRREAIVYAESQGAGKTTNLIAVGPDGKDRQQLAALPGNAWGPHIATDGRSIVYAVGAGASNDQTFVGGLGLRGLHDLYLLNLTGTVTTRLTTTTAWNAGWSWAPDGRTLAFTSDRDGNAEIYLLTFPEQQVRRLTTHAGQDTWPTWTPDGKAIIFMSTRDGYPQLYRMDANGGNTMRLITSEAADSFPTISPDGSKLAYVSQNFGATDGDIFVANLDGSNATRLTNTGDNGQPAWSPDGTRLAFASKRDGNYNIYTIRADGTGLTRLTNAPTDEVTPTWGVVEFPAGAAQQSPIAQFPLLGMIALGLAPSRRKQVAEDV